MLTSKVVGTAVSVFVIAALFLLGCDQAPTDTAIVSASGGSSVARPAVSLAKGNGGDVGLFTTIDYPGAPYTRGYGINAAGDIVGSYKDVSSVEHGFLLRNGAFTSFDYPGANWTQCWGISPQGYIVGQYGLPGNNTTHGFLLRDGTFTPIDIAGQPNTMLVKISPEGTIVGCYHVNNPNGTINLNTMHGFEMTAEGVVTSRPMSRTMDNGVNPEGDIVGFYFDPVANLTLSSYLIRNGETTWFQFEGSLFTQAWDINPAGTVVGFHKSSGSVTPLFHGFIMEQGAMESFDVDGASETRAYGISATGDIVGYYVSAGVNHGFLLTRRGPK